MGQRFTCGRGNCNRFIEGRQAYDELAAKAGSFTRRLHGSRMNLYQETYKSQPDAEAALGAVEGIVYLSEEVEDGCEFFLVNTDAIVGHAEDSLIARVNKIELDSSTVVRVFRGIIEKIGENLSHAYRIGIHW